MITLEIHAGSKYSKVLQAAGTAAGAAITSFLPTDVLTGTVWQGQSSTPLFTFDCSWFQSVTEVAMQDGGTNYSISPTVTFSGGNPSSTATAYAVVNGGVIAAVNIVDPGDGYTDIPTVLFTDASGAGAVAVADIVLGWQLGQVGISIDGSQTANLDPMGSYRAQIVVTRGTDSTKIIEFLIRVIGSPGVGTQPILPYCSLQDLLDVAPWITGVQDVDVDLEGFYSQRLKARLWLDDIIVAKYQNNYIGQFGAHSEAAFSALGIQPIGPDPTIIGYLASNFLILRPAVVQVCAHYAVGQIGLAQVVTGNMNLARLGQYHLLKANRDVHGITAELDPNQDGIAEIPVNLSTVMTMFG